MTAELLEASTVDRFRAAVARWLGLRFEEARTGLLAEVLQRALDRTALIP